MVDKVYPATQETRADDIEDGQSIGVGGFGLCGIPEESIATRSMASDDISDPDLINEILCMNWPRG